jgi:glucan biosynthesis protein C
MKRIKITEKHNEANVSSKSTQPLRCYYIDWLRVLTVLILFFFHNAHLFDEIYWHIKNKQQSFWATAFVVFVHLWGMPLLFLLAGASTWFARRYKRGTDYIRERFKRLVIPFSFGILIIVPPQIYLEGLDKSQFSGSFFHNYLHLFAKDPLTFDPQVFSNYGHHLWFLPFLFIFSCMNLPLASFLQNKNGLRFISRMATFLEKKANFFWSIIPVALIQILLRIKYPVYCSWADFWFWFAFFIYGYLIMADQRLLKTILKHGITGLLIGVGCVALIGYLYLTGVLANQLVQPEFSVGYVLFMVLYSLAAWAWVIFIFNLGIRFLNFKNRFLQYAQEAVLPFYILHPTVILLIGFYGVRWNLSIIAKFLLISGSSFVLITATYEFLIRRIQFLRIFFGLKALKSPDK